MKCLNLNIPSIAKAYEELTQVFGDEKVAYALLAQNNGFNLDLDLNGESSKLYNDILKLATIQGNRSKALQMKARAYSDSFLDRNGDWLSAGVEPDISTLTKTEDEAFTPDITYQNAKKEADSRPRNTLIPQNVNGKGNSFTLKSNTPEGNTSSIDMIINGTRTRTTRSKAEFEKYNVKKGSFTYMFGVDNQGITQKVLVEVTDVYPKSDPRFVQNWKLENWNEPVSKIKNLEYAIEFKVVKKQKKVNKYKPSDVPFIQANTVQQLEDIIPEIDNAISSGVTAFVKQKKVGDNIINKKNIFTVTPIQSVDKKAIIKASIATKFIGFAEGISGSSTETYRNQVGNLGNTGNYTSTDVVFVSIGGKRGDATIRKQQQDRTIREVFKAVEAGATIITDNKNYVDSSDYNEGEKRLAKNLEAKGYVYSEQTVDGQLLGIWNKVNMDTTLDKHMESKGFEYIENEDAGFYVKKQQIDEAPSPVGTVNSKELNTLLDKANVLFSINGIEDAKGDEYIESLNSKLFENLFDQQRLINKMAYDMWAKQKADKLSGHSVVTMKSDDNGNYWITMTDESYHKTWDDAKSPNRRANIIARNRQYIADTNQEIYNLTGKYAMSIKDVNVGIYKGGIVTFNEDALQDYNAAKYIEYLNAIKLYKNKGKSPSVADEAFDMLPLKKKLKSELAVTKKEKTRLESEGAKQIDIFKLGNKIEDLKERIEVIQKSEDLNDIYNEAELNFIEIKHLLNSKQLSPQQFRTSLEKLEMWIAAGDFSNTQEHPFLDEEEAKSEVIQEKFTEIRGKADRLMNDLTDKGKVLLTNIVNDKFATELTFEEVVTLGHKLGWWPKNMYSLNRVGHALAQFIQATVNEANEAANREAKTEAGYLADLYQKVKAKGIDERIFYQTTEDGVFTGGLVQKFADKYFKAKNKKVKFRKESELVLNPTLLFESSEEIRNAHITEIESNLGPKEAIKYIEKARIKYENYLKTREQHIAVEYDITDDIPTSMAPLSFEEKRATIINAVNEGKTFWIKYKSKRGESKSEEATWRRIDKAVINKAQTQLSDVEGSSDLKTFNIALEYRLLDVSMTDPTTTDELFTPEQKSELATWEKLNSPIERIKSINATKEKDLLKVVGKDTFLEIIPRKIVTGKETGYYDSKFSVIEADEDLYEFYQKAESITNNAQVAFDFKDIRRNSLAFVERSLMAKISQDGVANFLRKDLWDNVLSSFSGGKVTKKEIDPITKKPVKKVRIQAQTIDQLISASFKKKLAEAVAAKQDKLTEEERKDLYAQASNEVMKEMPFDANNTSLFASLNMLNYAALSYKHSSLIEDTVNLAMTYLPNSTVNTGEDIVDSKGNSVGDEYIKNLQDMVEHTLSVSYYKYPRQDTSTSLIPLHSAEQKKQLSELRKALNSFETTKEEKIKIQEQIKQIQSESKRVTTNSLMRGLMSFLRLKGMGWNLPAAFANLAYGKITNLYAAIEGRMFDRKDFVYAEKAFISQHKKFNKVVENYHVVGDILYEFKNENKFEENKNWFFKSIKALKPYAMQTATEKSNQGTVMIAMMQHQKVTNAKGETKTMWEAIEDDGVLSNEWMIGSKAGANAVNYMVAKIKSQIETIHGDYSNPTLIKKTMAGQASIMYKGWFPEVFHSRFGPEKMDYIRGLVTKGRYRTLLDLAKMYSFNPKAIYNAYKNGELSEVDKVNMKVNLMELTTMVISFALYNLLKSAMCGDEENCKNSGIIQATTMNLTKKVMQDVTFYVNPESWKNFISNPVAMTSVLGDMAKLVSLSYVGVMGEEGELITQSGANKGENKLWLFGKSQLPLVTSVERMRRYGEDIIQNR